MLDWLIIGGGIHGTYMSNYFTDTMGISSEKVRVLDPNEENLARWKQCTANTGMRFLRSSVVQQIDTDPFSLQKFARKVSMPDKFTYPNDRPSIDLFNIHAEHIIKKKGLDKLRIKGNAENIILQNSGLKISTDNGDITARKVMLAIGMSDQPFYPEWSVNLKKYGAEIHHIFEKDFIIKSLDSWSHVVIIGGGITAVQTALSLSETGKKVTLLSRHSLRVHQYDSAPGWMGKYLNIFYQEKDYTGRREIIKRARNRGSIPPEVLVKLRYAIKTGKINFIVDEEKEVSYRNPIIKIDLKNTSESLQPDLVILATGFEGKRPGGRFIDKLIGNLELNYAPCGFPIVEPSLNWGHNIYVTGPLAELEIGPASRNIIGVRMSGERLKGNSKCC